VPRPDTASFNRLLTSLGFLAFAAALAIPYFFYRSTDTLRINRSELAALTWQARQTIEDRQADVARIQPFVLPTSGALIVAGIFFLIWGGSRLRGAQERDDREATARMKKAEEGVRDLTDQEKEAKIEKEAEGAARASERVNPDGTAGGSAAPPPASGTADRIASTRRIEQQIGSVLSRSDLPGYLFRSQVAVGNRLQLDGLFLATNELEEDILLDVRVIPPTPGNFIVERLLGRKARYEAERRRKCRPWLVLVVPESVRDPGSVRIDGMHRRVKDLLDPIGWATVIREREIESLPAIFKGLHGGFENLG
jgi:hypothetical protein